MGKDKPASLIENTAGWPRPRRTWTDNRGRRGYVGQERQLPVPWILGQNKHGEIRWTVFKDDWTVAAHGHLCQVCGEVLSSIKLLGIEKPGMTSGSACHPRCMALALSLCPHLIDASPLVAYRYDGPGPGFYVPDQELLLQGLPEYEVMTTAVPYTASDVVELARQNPMGGLRS